MKRHKSILDKVTISADLQGEPLPGVPLVELAGNNRVLIENHKGVCQYSCDRICVKVKYGQVVISGCGLQLSRMSNQQLIIQGQIFAIQLVRG